MLRVGVIGTGVMGVNHIRIYHEMEEVELVGISDIDEKRVNELSRKYHTEPFTDYKELLLKGLDAVSIVVPTKLHKQVCLDALEAGVNVLVEKPIADTPENADIMIQAAKDAGKALMIGHIERFNPAVIKLKEIIKEGVLGKIVSISTIRVGSYNPRIRDVGVILDIGVHDIDIISYLYDLKVNKVHAIAGANIHPYEDHASIHLRFNHDLTGLVSTNWLTPHKIRNLTAVGLDGVAYLDYINQTLELHDKKWIREAKVNTSEPLRNELEYFTRCVSTGENVYPNGENGKHALEVCMAAIESYKQERTIKL